MNEAVDIAVEFAGLKLANPVFTASGTCGYADELADFMDVNKLGGFITKSITLKPRKGNPPQRAVETDSGMLNAIGLANIGAEAFIAEKIPLIEKMTVPVFVNVAGSTSYEYVTVAEKVAQRYRHLPGKFVFRQLPTAQVIVDRPVKINTPLINQLQG